MTEKEIEMIAPQHLLDMDLLHSCGVHRGLNWAIGQGHLGLNGYVQIPEDHPWHELMEVDLEVTVHGGLTFVHDGWIGFDTAHYGDVWETTPASMKQLYTPEAVTLWTEEMLRDEVLRLADQVADNA